VKSIELVIDTKGQVTLQTHGYAGSSCTDATRQLEAALGQKLQDERTGEYFQGQRLTENQQAKA
jgi:hypothetical protein